MPPALNLIGNKYGRWTVIDRAENINGRTAWICKCECGTEKVIKIHDLRNKRTNSCGCLRKENTKSMFSKHGLSNHRLFKIWTSMKTRCYNKNATNYERYGARGISICDEWNNDFMKFYNWSINNGYSDNLTIDRVNNNGNYEPSNCRWATVKEQNSNKRPYKSKRNKE